MKFAHLSHIWNSANSNFGDIEETNLMRSITLFGKEVIPALRSFETYLR